MIAFLIRRLFQGTLVMLCVGLVAFWIFQSLGDPIEGMLGQEATRQDREELRERLGLNDPAVVQFGRFVLRCSQGNFGISYRNQRPVGDLIQERLPATLELVLVAACLSLSMGIPMGVYTALRRNRFSSHLLQTVSLIGISLPTFVTGIILILVFSVILKWLPSFGRGEVVQLGWWSTGFLRWSGIKALIMPGFTLALLQLTLIMRLVRAEMLEVLRTDYIRFARARGLTNRAVHFSHALRNTLVPVVTIVGLQLGSLIAFAVITETVFQWPGMGFLFIQAVNFVDIPVMSAYLVLVAFLFVIINIIVDLLYYVIDPRLRVEKSAGGGGGH
ncbi:MAG: ABC transporter permease [Candidatus Methanosuratus sp.]|nr:ABC transporter permease [Candidatus Methanosuratincola sp.]